jgi:hypothetical protein
VDGRASAITSLSRNQSVIQLSSTFNFDSLHQDLEATSNSAQRLSHPLLVIMSFLRTRAVLLAALLHTPLALAAPISHRERPQFMQVYRLSSERQLVITATVPTATQITYIFVLSILIAAMIEAILVVWAYSRGQQSIKLRDEQTHSISQCSQGQWCRFHGHPELTGLELSEKMAIFGDESILRVYPEQDMI